jgi:diaminohydroxyphosphoribosylaminopyrimidine deaminase/5-amino-6-(5-phosphoribosylamino)uracil reductase
MNYADLMKRAISLAGIHKYTAKPNPVVGAILVKDDLIISEGAHEQYGMEHAEVNAINNAKKYIGKTFQSFEELTLLCTLEPCNHSGKTGPCSDAIIKSGIKKVIIGCKDPNPKVAGTGIIKLIDNDIEVELGLHEELIKEQNKFFFFKHENNRPYITVKIASSSDGKSHNLDGSSTWITCKESREDVQIVRAMHDSILTGGNTLVDDNPRMNARVKFAVNQPKKILLTSKKDLDYKNNFFINSDVIVIKENNIKKIIKSLNKSDICSILVEAGPQLVNSFLSSGLVDELIIYESPNLLGPEGVSWFKEDNAVEKLGFKLESSYKIESDSKKIYKNVKR